MWLSYSNASIEPDGKLSLGMIESATIATFYSSFSN